MLGVAGVQTCLVPPADRFRRQPSTCQFPQPCHMPAAAKFGRQVPQQTTTSSPPRTKKPGTWPSLYANGWGRIPSSNDHPFGAAFLAGFFAAFSAAGNASAAAFSRAIFNVALRLRMACTCGSCAMVCLKGCEYRTARWIWVWMRFESSAPVRHEPRKRDSGHWAAHEQGGIQYEATNGQRSIGGLFRYGTSNAGVPFHCPALRS